MTGAKAPRALVAFACALWLLFGGLGHVAQSAGQFDPQTSEFGVPRPGRHIYARPGLLSDEREALFEREAAAIERSGLRVVVFMRIYEATYAETQHDAAELLNHWQVESEPGARDGVVIFANMRVSNPEYGWVALASGAGAVRERALTPDQLSEIRRWMIADIVLGDMPEGILEGLRQLAYLAQFGPTPRQELTSLQSSIASALRGPLAILAAVVCLLLTGTGVRVWRGRFPTLAIPNLAPVPARIGLSPATRGALRDGRVSPSLATTTIADLAARGALAIEPVEPRLVRVYLLAPLTNPLPHEAAMWDALAASRVSAGEISVAGLSQLSNNLTPFSRALRLELEGRGWFDPVASDKRRTLALAGSMGLMLAIGFALLALVGRERWGLASAMAIAAIALTLLYAASRYPSTTAQGRAALAASRPHIENTHQEYANHNVSDTPPPSPESLARLETLLAGGRPA